MARAQVFVGIDVGHASVKVAAVSRREDGWHIEAAALEPLAVPPEASEEEREAREGEVVKRALDALRTRAAGVAINVPAAMAPIRKVELPHASGDDMERMIRFEAERFLPLPVDDVNLDHHLIQGQAQTQNETLIVACRKALVARRARLAESVTGTEPVVDVDALAVFNALAGPIEEKQVTTLVDIGAAATSVIVARSGEIELARTAMLGSEELTAAFAEDLHVTEREAMEAKWREGLTEVQGVTDQPSLATWQEASEQRPSVARWLGRLCQEIRHTCESYRSQATHGAVQEIVLAGGGALAPGLAEALTSALGVPTRVVSGWGQLGVVGEADGPPAQFAAAVGLALRAAGGAVVAINLVPRAARASRRARGRLSLVAVAGVVLGLGIAGGAWWSLSEVGRREQKLAQLEADVERLERVTGGVESAQAEWAALDAIEALAGRAHDPRRTALGLLRDASEALPPDDVWIEEYTYERGRLLRVRGHAFFSPLVKDTVSALAQYEHLGDVVLDDVVRGEIAGKTVFSFTISCHLPPEEEEQGESKRTRR